MTALLDASDPLAQTSAPASAPGRSRSGGGLLRYIIIRVLLIIPTVFILVTVVFFLMRTTGDPITAAQGGRLPPDELARFLADFDAGLAGIEALPPKERLINIDSLKSI